MAEITKDQDYINNRGEYCPYCLSEGISKNGTPSIGGGFIKIPKRCLTSDYEWRDHYALIGYEKRRYNFASSVKQATFTTKTRYGKIKRFPAALD